MIRHVSVDQNSCTHLDILALQSLVYILKVANDLSVSYLTFTIISLKSCTTILDLSAADLGFSIRFAKDVEFGCEVVILRSSNIKDLVKKGVDL